MKLFHMRGASCVRYDDSVGAAQRALSADP